MNHQAIKKDVVSPLSVLAAAETYVKKGYSPIPVPFRKKKPVLPKWEQLRLTAETLSEYFTGGPQNVGVLLGEASGWLIDVDLDHPLCVELAAKFLPPTPAIFGRLGKPRSHWVYCVSNPVATKQHNSKSVGMLVELRSTGAQTIFPPSVHESGENIAWVDPDAEPSVIEPKALLDAVKQLADAVKVKLGLKPDKPSREPRAPKQKSAPTPRSSKSEPIVAGSRNQTLTSRAGKLLRLGMSEDEIFDALRHTNQTLCQPPLDEAEVGTIAASVARYSPGRGIDRDEAVGEDGSVSLGSRDPESGRLVLSPKKTLPTATAYVRQFHRHPEADTLIAYLGRFLAWSQGCYREMDEAAIQQALQKWLHQALRYIYQNRTDSLELIDFESSPATVKSALESIRASVYIPSTVNLPFWRGHNNDRPAAHELLACRSTLLHLPTMSRYPATPALFTLNALDFDYDPEAADPIAWLNFLDQLFSEDLESIELLQEWFGYCLIADTSQQKMLLMVGPKRSGKGTIARILRQLVGAGNFTGPTTSSLAGPFGLQPLLFKTLAIVSDARFHGENISTVIERLLCISGEDTVTVDRKFLESVTLKLATRFMFLSNELPRLTDASGALASRFLVLRLSKSFYGREDHCLTEKLLSEMPGILNWAIAGWQRLHARGHFVQPRSVAEAIEELEELGSPVKAFVREKCVVGPRHRVYIDDLFEAWTNWCASEGRQLVSTKQTFGRDLSAAFPSIVRRRNPRPFYEGIDLAQDISF